MNRLLELSQNALAEMRALLLELRPQTQVAEDDSNQTSIPGLIRVQREGLAPAIRRYAHNIARDGLQIEVDDTDYPPLTGVRTMLVCEEGVYRIAQEALNNVVKHAQAQHVHLKLALRARMITLKIMDNGHGFVMQGDAPAHGYPNQGIGLKTMRERAVELGGTLHVSSILHRGTTVEMTIPWQEKRVP